ncbi:MAG: TlpA disulfide reductase family protein [Planctomycetota bacterium]
MIPRASVLAAALLAASTAAADDIKLKLLPNGERARIGVWTPQDAKLSADQPATVTKVPAGLAAPRFGVLRLAGPEGATFHVLLDEPAGKTSKLWVDANGNGDLTDDPAADWKPSKEKTKFPGMAGSAKLNIGTKEAAVSVTVALFASDKKDPAAKDGLFYAADYAREGELKLGDKAYHVALADVICCGDFRGVQPATDGGRCGVLFLVDINANGKFDAATERFDIRKPFNVAGTAWEISGMTKDGGSFAMAKSTEEVPEGSTPPDHSAGQPITPFEAKLLDGRIVKFPSDYKGKVVLLDFWATWCGPCMKEVPGLVAAYEKYKGRGFEVLGVSLDQPNAEKKIKEVCAEKKMTWPHVYDGGGWKAEIAQIYGIHSIPACYLIDGDTGEILAVGQACRGGALEGSVDEALTKKGK